MFTLFLFGMFIPYQGVMIPLVQLLVGLNDLTGLPGVFYGGLPGLILAHVVYGIPICTLIFRNYYVTIPDELIEASRVDGAGMLRTYWSVVLPVSAPGLRGRRSSGSSPRSGTTSCSPSSSPARRAGPATVMLNNIAGAQATPYSQQMAAAILSSIPTMLIYVLLGRFFMRGLMAGALKG